MEQEVTIDESMMKLATEALSETLEPLADLFEDSMAKGRFQEQQRDVIEALKAVKKKHGFISRSALLRQVKQSTQDLDKVTKTLVDASRLIFAKHITGKRGRVPMMYRLLRRGEDFDEKMEQAGKFWNTRDNDGK